MKKLLILALIVASGWSGWFAHQPKERVLIEEHIAAVYVVGDYSSVQDMNITCPEADMAIYMSKESDHVIISNNIIKIGKVE